MAKASGVRRCVRSGCGAGLGRAPSNSGHSFSFKFWCAQLYWGKQGRTDADVVWAHIITDSSRLNSPVTRQVWDNVQV